MFRPLSWPSSGRCHKKDISQKLQEQIYKHKILNFKKYGTKYMLKYTLHICIYIYIYIYIYCFLGVMTLFVVTDDGDFKM